LCKRFCRSAPCWRPSPGSRSFWRSPTTRLDALWAAR
jgi:hypothetical protein